MFQIKKQKKPRVLRMGTRRLAVIMLWLLLIFAFAFAVYKNFTAVNTHTVHETTMVQEKITDTNALEGFVTDFAKVYYAWEQTTDSIEQRGERLKDFLTSDLQAMNADTVRGDIPTRAVVQDVQIWSVEKSAENMYSVCYTVTQAIKNGEKSSVVTSAYEVTVYRENDGRMVIVQNPTITGTPAKSDYVPKAVEPDGTVSAQETTEIIEFLTTFFKLYPAASARELAYYVSGDVLPVIENDSYVFAELVNPVCTKTGDVVTANVAVKYLDQRTGMTQISQFVLQLKQVDGNWKIS